MLSSPAPSPPPAPGEREGHRSVKQQVTCTGRPVRGKLNSTSRRSGRRSEDAGGAAAFDVDEGGTEVVPSRPTANGLQRRNLGRISSAYNSKKSR